MKHDIIISILATNSKQKYIDRISDLEPYLILNNIKTAKIDLVGDNCEKPKVVPDDYYWFKPKYDKLYQKLWCYLDSLNIENLPKWLMQCDDDCATDVGKLYELLNSYYDHNDPICLEATQNYDFSHPYHPIVKNFMPTSIHYTANDWQSSNMIHHHSWGSHVFSYGMLRKMKEWNRFHEWCNSIYRLGPSFSDHLPTMLALALKTPCCEAKFLHSFFNMNEFTGINENGHYAQIHYTHRLIPEWGKFTSIINNKKPKVKVKNDDQSINEIPRLINRQTFKKKKISIRAYSKIRPREHHIIELYNDGNAEISGNVNLMWNLSSNGEMLVLDRATKKRMAEIKSVGSKGDFIIKMNLNNNDSSLIWNGQEI